MLFAVIAIIAIVLFLPRVVEKNSIVINTEDGLVRDCQLPFLVPRFDLLSFSQLQMKLIGINEIISKNLMQNIIPRFMQFRNNLNKVAYRLYFLGNDIKRRDGPFLGERLGAMEVSIS